MWNLLTEEEQRFLATAEIFWQDHAGAVGMDFGPVVIEIAKAFQSLAVRTVIDPLRAWAGANGRQVGQVQTMGDIRAELQRVAELQAGSTRPRDARALADNLDETAQRDAALGHALTVLGRIYPLRRDAAHPHRITNRAAADFRSWTLGLGSEACAISVLIDQLVNSESE
jgi:hypothetical protein